MASSVTHPETLEGQSQRRGPVSLSYNDLPRRFGRYVLLRRIAKGGMGEVMLASTLGLEGAERPVIIKTIRTEHRTDKSFKARFLDEARVQAQLEHAGVAQILEATTDEESGEPYVAVEYVDGRSLGDVRARALTTGVRIEWHEAVAIAQLCAEALAHVHERCDHQNRPLAIVHRDLSPQNLMVGYGGEIKIIDFGTARGENRRCHTVSGVVFAKPGYVAPEVANGDSGDFRVDLYALGVMLWELCAGRRFLSGEASDHMAAVAKNERNLPPVAELCAAPRALDDLIERLTAFDREKRYPRSKHAARDLAALLGTAPMMPGGERGVRGRVTLLMQRLFEGESARTKREFLRLVGEARKVFGSLRTPQAPTPRAVQVIRDEQDGLLPGTRYLKLRELGQGSGTSVFECEHQDLGRRVAVKVATAEASEADKARITHEAKVLSGLEMPGVIKVIDAGRTLDQRPFVVLELLSAETLDKRLEGGAALPWAEALTVVDAVLEVLERVHKRGVVHRDLKPSNVLITDDGRATLLDFGIALSKADLSDLDSPAPERATVALWGTPEYMAPEQAARPQEADERADLYAVGSVLYELVTGRLPFVGKSPVALLEIKSQGSPEAPSERAKTRSIPAEVDALCLRALARHPSLRFTSASEMRVAIASALTAPERARRRRRRFGFAAIGATMGCAALLIGATLAQPSGAAGVLEKLGLRPRASTALADATPEPAMAPSPSPLSPTPADALTESPAGQAAEAVLPTVIEPSPDPTEPAISPLLAEAEDRPPSILEDAGEPEAQAAEPKPTKKANKKRRADKKSEDAPTKKKSKKKKPAH